MSGSELGHVQYNPDELGPCTPSRTGHRGVKTGLTQPRAQWREVGRHSKEVRVSWMLVGNQPGR